MGTDRDYNIIPPYRRADFRRVLRYRKAEELFRMKEQQRSEVKPKCAPSHRVTVWEAIN
ncbi:MAG: hypothetical protein WCZ43_09265 [Proteiniphilum sp.]